MSIVGKILAETQFTETIDDLPFVLRIVTAEMAASVIGNKTLGLMRAGTGSKELPKEETLRITKGYLDICMVSPKFGSESSAETDTISFDDLGSLPDKILTAVFKKSGFESLGKSNDSCEDTEAGS